VIEACTLLADGAPSVLLVAYDNRLPAVFKDFEECREQPHAWAWLMVPADVAPIHLNWTTVAEKESVSVNAMPPSLDILRFYLRGAPSLERVADRRCWRWTRDA
jgi:hypothetical protein